VARLQIAATHGDTLAEHSRPADRPLGHAAVHASEVIVISVADIRNALEARRKPATDLVLPDELAQGSDPGRLEDTVLGEVGHDRIEAVSVERVEHLTEAPRRCGL
jgi:hypothetical protein